MKQYTLTILLCLTFTIYSCTDSYQKPTEVDPKEYNEKIADGIQTHEEWVKTPEGIAKRLFPRIAHQEGNPSYNINEQRFSDINRKITITEEGAFDDEVMGEKTIIYIKMINDKWEITKMFISLKRRY